MNYLTSATLTKRVMNAVAAGTSDQNSASVDMVGYEGVRFIALFGTLTATQVTSMKLQGSDDNSSWSDLEGTSTGPLADADSNDMLICEAYRPRHRYVRAVIDRGTANAVIDGVIAEVYGPRVMPVTQDATVIAAEKHASPAAGTA